MFSSITITLLAASTAMLSLAQRFDLPPATSLPTGWDYNGCYTDSVRHRELSGEFIFDNGSNTTTATKCIDFCSSKNYSAAGLEYGGECFCGDSLPEQTGTTGCNFGCAGDKAQACGGSNRLTVYTSLKTYEGGSNWTSKGCYSDDREGRTLSKLADVPGGYRELTPELCISTCAGLNYTFAGVEYGGECFCGNEISNNATVSSAGGCTMACYGNSTYLCGGPDRINVYQAK